MAKNYYKASFNLQWLDSTLHQEWSKWLREAKSEHYALCIYCKKEFSLSNMATRAINSHESSKKHQSITKCLKSSSPDMFKNFVKQSTGSNNSKQLQLNNSVSSSCSQGASVGSTLDVSFRKAKDVQKAEIMWSLTVNQAHISNRASDCCQKQFSKMFPDSQIAQSFGVSKDKLSYLCVFGLAPYFTKKFQGVLRNTSYISISYDEALNKIAQRTQMDIHVRFEDLTKGLITTRYLTSQFLTDTRAENLLENLKQGLGSAVDLIKVTSISMDGPNVNWKMLSLLKAELNTCSEAPRLIEFGSCSLHVVHGALKTGHKATKWDLLEYLRASYYLFNDFPTRRGTFMKITGSEEFPAKFCLTRWVENVNATTTAIRLLPRLRKYVEEVGELKNSKVFGKVKSDLKDPLLHAKLGFFQAVARQLEGFLLKYQREDPLTPFLYDDLSHLVKTLIKRVLKPDIYCSDIKVLMKINFKDKKNFINAEKMDLYNTAKEGIRNAPRRLQTPEILKFREDCMLFLQVLIQKLLERSPLKYSITKALSCLSPKVMLSNNSERINMCVEKFIDIKRIDGSTADIIKEDYELLISNFHVLELLKSFDEKEDRLDQLFIEIFKTVNVQKETKCFVTLILSLFHGNASVERGFSTNKHCLQENLREESLVAKRVIAEEMKNTEGVDYCITNEMMSYCRNASSEYKTYLKRKLSAKEAETREGAKKMKLAAEIKETESIKRNIVKETEKQLHILEEKIAFLKQS